jgi:hypothetical protein
MCHEMARLHILAPFYINLIQSFWVPCDLSSKNFSKKNLLFEAEIYVSGFCTIYPRASGGLERPTGHKDHLASKVGKPTLQA